MLLNTRQRQERKPYSSPACHQDLQQQPATSEVSGLECCDCADVMKLIGCIVGITRMLIWCRWGFVCRGICSYELQVWCVENHHDLNQVRPNISISHQAVTRDPCPPCCTKSPLKAITTFNSSLTPQKASVVVQCCGNYVDAVGEFKCWVCSCFGTVMHNDLS